eukprot:11216595-Lingulodinium_polyedra.AAC.1
MRPKAVVVLAAFASGQRTESTIPPARSTPSREYCPGSSRGLPGGLTVSNQQKAFIVQFSIAVRR